MQYLELEQKYIEVQKDLQKQTENSIKINGVSLVQTRVIDFETEMLQKSSVSKRKFRYEISNQIKEYETGRAGRILPNSLKILPNHP